MRSRTNTLVYIIYSLTVPALKFLQAVKCQKWLYHPSNQKHKRSVQLSFKYCCLESQHSEVQIC